MAEVEHSKRRMVLVECKCGARTEVDLSKLRAGKTRSCRRCSMLGKNTTHGESGKNTTPEYRAWYSSIQRCSDPGHWAYQWYGSRGIQVCEEWRSEGGYERFLAHVGRRSSDRHSLDRIDNDSGYAPGNVRWATAKEQANNRRKRAS